MSIDAHPLSFVEHSWHAPSLCRGLLSYHQQCDNDSDNTTLHIILLDCIVEETPVLSCFSSLQILCIFSGAIPQTKTVIRAKLKHICDQIGYRGCGNSLAWHGYSCWRETLAGFFPIIKTCTAWCFGKTCGKIWLYCIHIWYYMIYDNRKHFCTKYVGSSEGWVGRHHSTSADKSSDLVQDDWIWHLFARPVVDPTRIQRILMNIVFGNHPN